VLSREPDIGAVIAEPIRCTTVTLPPPGYWQRIRAACDRHEALLVFDEIPICLGRTGRMFAFEHEGVLPDILVLGKGLGGGIFPMAAIVARAELDIAPDRALGHYTHEKSPVGAAAALATLDVIRDEGLVERSERLGHQVLEQLRTRLANHPLIASVRGRGLLMAIELAPAAGPDTADRVMYECMRNGLSLKVSAGHVLTLTPPLTMTESDLARAMSILEAAIRSILSGKASRS
jgi:4-aminobutyrate aminotransferase